MTQMSLKNALPCEIYQYHATHANFYPAQAASKIPVELTSSTLDEKERRRKRSDASKSSEKETTSNMHLVGYLVSVRSRGMSLLRSSGAEHKTVRLNAHSESARRSTSKASNINSKSFTRNTKTSSNHITSKPTKYRD